MRTHDFSEHQGEIQQIAERLKAGGGCPSPTDWMALVDFQMGMLRALMQSHRGLLDALKKVQSERDDLLAANRQWAVAYHGKQPGFTVN